MLGLGDVLASDPFRSVAVAVFDSGNETAVLAVSLTNATWLGESRPGKQAEGVHQLVER